MDSVAVSAAIGLAVGRPTLAQTARVAFSFGAVQAIMTLLGLLAGHLIEPVLAQVDHFVAFGLLLFVGLGMIRSGFRGEDADFRVDPTRRARLLFLSVATSIDAMAVGFSMALLGAAVLFLALVIGLTTVVFSGVALQVGRPFGPKAGPVLEVLGGLVLIGLGVKTLGEHLAS